MIKLVMELEHVIHHTGNKVAETSIVATAREIM